MTDRGAGSGARDSTVVWVSGASSGIGAQFANLARNRADRVIGISRRPSAGEHIPADLSDPAAWREVEASFRRVLADRRVGRAIFFHCAGTIVADGPTARADTVAYGQGIMLNSASGQALGQAFLTAVEEAGVKATLLLCSSPSATIVTPGLSHYCAGKAALEMWVRTVAAEVGEKPGAPRVFAVVPWAVDTPMVHDVMAESGDDLPLSDDLRRAAGAGELAGPADVAREIWQAIDNGVEQGANVHVGMVPEEP
ncbi:MAG TPA: SDR family oxidoreductase [Solirubrobacterales bacterium]|nr:SDR family oxidoreductase [Solirubrobacterales bacterium]